MTTTETAPQAAPTAREAEYLRHRDEFHAEHQRFPTLRESGAVLRMSFTGVYQCRVRLVRKGLIKRPGWHRVGDVAPLSLPPLDFDRLSRELSRTKLDYLKAIHAGLTGVGHAPSHDEYSESRGWAGRSYPTLLRSQLVRDGYIEAERYKARAVRLTPKCFAPEANP